MGEILVSFREVDGTASSGSHLFLIYRQSATTPYADWKVIRPGNDDPSAGTVTGPIMIAQTDIKLQNSLDAFDFNPDSVGGLIYGLPEADWNALSIDEQANQILAYHGAQTIYSGGDVADKWADMVAAAQDLDLEYSYQAFSIDPISIYPTINSNAFVNSVLYHSGFTYAGNEPTNLALTPGQYNLLGTRGDDVLSTFGETDTLVGGAGDDTLIGDARSNALLGSEGDDTFVGHEGADVLFGGERLVSVDGQQVAAVAGLDDGMDTAVLRRHAMRRDARDLPA